MFDSEKTVLLLDKIFVLDKGEAILKFTREGEKNEQNEKIGKANGFNYGNDVDVQPARFRARRHERQNG